MSIASHAWVQSPVLKTMKDKQKFFWNFPFSSKTVEFTYKRVHRIQSAEKEISNKSPESNKTCSSEMRNTEKLVR